MAENFDPEDPRLPFLATPEVRREFESLERFKREARRRHRLSAAECIEIVSQLSKLFPESKRGAERFEFREDAEPFL